MSDLHKVYIALGANLGDRRGAIESALLLLQSHPEVSQVYCSTLHETAPVGGPPGQGPFLNAAARLSTTLSPEALLDLLHKIERDLGRVRYEHWGPRTIDLDLLFYDDLVIDQPGLTVPHPRLHERRFVLEPLAEIEPELVHPVVNMNIVQILKQLQ